MVKKCANMLLAVSLSWLFSVTANSQTFNCPDSVQELILAIIQANTNLEDDIIDLNNQEFVVTSAIAIPNLGNTAFPLIKGPNNLLIQNGTIQIATWVANLQARHFAVDVGGSLSLQNVNLLNGSAPGSGGPGLCAFPLLGAGGSILNNGQLNLDRVQFWGNSAACVGGAVFNSPVGVMSQQDSTYWLNRAGLASDPTDGWGGAIFNDADPVLGHGVIDRIINSTFSNNSANMGGGAIFNDATSTGGSAPVTQSATINIMSNSTVVFNSAAFSAGLLETLPSGATGGGGLWLSGTIGSGDVSSSVGLFISNLVALNTLVGGPLPVREDIYDLATNPVLTPTNTSYTLISALLDLGDATALALVPSNILPPATSPNPSYIDPLVYPIANNGGNIYTVALQSALSPAYNRGANPIPLFFDERGPGYLRVVDGAADIGAYELQNCANNGGDADNDGVCNPNDNCPCTPNPGQADCNHNGVGDACDNCPCPCICEEPCDNTCHNCPPDHDHDCPCVPSPQPLPCQLAD